MSSPSPNAGASGCPVNHKAMPPADGCPVAHGGAAPSAAAASGAAAAYPDACPMSSNSSAVLMAAASATAASVAAQQQKQQAQAQQQQAQQQGLPPREFLPGAPTFPVAYRVREETGTGVVGDVFPDSRPIAGQRRPLSTLPSRSIIPKAFPAPAAADAGAKPAPAPGALPATASNAVVPAELAPAKVGSIALTGAANSNSSSDPAALVCTSDAIGGDATEETWTFPSQQRFYNAMKKKGWNPREEDLPYIVSIHNTINEQCWRKVMAFEALHADSCATPKLLRFQGLPTEYSLKARFKSWMGYVLPFDRHDWTVDRCGKHVRYIIDFYNGPDDPTRPATVYLDVRPAPTLGGVVDRARMWWKNLFTI